MSISVRTLDDTLGKGAKVIEGNRSYEARTKNGFQTRLFLGHYESSEGYYHDEPDHYEFNLEQDADANKDRPVAIVRIPTANGAEYEQFKVLTDRLNSAFNTTIKNRKQDFIDYLAKNQGFKNDNLRLKINTEEFVPTDLIEFSALNSKGIFAGVLNSSIFCGILGCGLYLHPVDGMIIATPALLYGLSAFTIDLLANVDRRGDHIVLPLTFSLPYYQFRWKEQENAMSDRGFEKLLSMFAKQTKLQKEYDDNSETKKLIKLNRKLSELKSEVKSYWNALRAAQFEYINDLQGITVAYEPASKADAFDFANYIVNGGDYTPKLQPKKKVSDEGEARRAEIRQTVDDVLKERGVKLPVEVIDLTKTPPEKKDDVIENEVLIP